MKNHHMKLIVAGVLLLGIASAQAQEADAMIVSITEPMHSNGIHIGDVLKRSVTLEVKPPYQISKNVFPMKGSNQDGMELLDFKVETAQNGQETRYRLDYSYQVFANARMPSVMQLPMERLVLTGGPKALTINIPSWHFWFSPLVNGDILTAKANLQPQHKPELVDIGTHRTLLTGFIGLLITSLAVAIYFNADRRWLPFMGGAFAQAHRRIKRLSDTFGEEKKALMYLHQAFNQIYGRNLFAREIEDFLVAHPGYTRMRKDIVDFFQRSNKALFAVQPNDRAAFIRELVILSKGLRDCERGLR